MNEPLDVADPGDLEQDVRAHHVIHSEIVRISKGIVHVRLGSEMNNRIDAAFVHDETDEIWNGNVALHGSA